MWVCDPVDGTAMYARHIPVAVFSLALVVDGVPVVGVVYDVFTDNFNKYFDTKYNFLINDFQRYLENHKSIILTGFVNFRINNYMSVLEEVVDEAVNAFIIEKEYYEFISLLQTYVNSQFSKTDILHLVYNNETSILLDKDKNVIDMSDEIFKLKYLFPFILEYCNNYDYSLRIIYHGADFDSFKTFLDLYEIPVYISLLNLKEDNYLDLGLKEKYVCTSWRDAKCLMNTSSINSTIYFYLDDLSMCNDLDFYRISSMCYENNIVILNDDLNKLKKLKNFSYDYDIEINKKMADKYRILCCDFGDMINEGIELLNYLCLNKILDFNLWSIFIGSKDNISMIYSDINDIINNNPENLDIDLFLKFDFNKNDSELNNENVIKIIFKKIKDKNYNVLDVTDIGEVFLFDKFILSKRAESNQVLQISEIIRNIDEVN